MDNDTNTKFDLWVFLSNGFWSLFSRLFGSRGAAKKAAMAEQNQAKATREVKRSYLTRQETLVDLQQALFGEFDFYRTKFGELSEARETGAKAFEKAEANLKEAQVNSGRALMLAVGKAERVRESGADSEAIRQAEADLRATKSVGGKMILRAEQELEAARAATLEETRALEREFYASLKRLYALFDQARTKVNERAHYFEQSGVTEISFPLKWELNGPHLTFRCLMDEEVAGCVQDEEHLNGLLDGKKQPMEDAGLVEVDLKDDDESSGSRPDSREQQLTLSVTALAAEDRQVVAYYDQVRDLDRHVDLLMFQGTPKERNRLFEIKRALVALQCNFLFTVITSGYDKEVVGAFDLDFKSRIEALDGLVTRMTESRRRRVQRERVDQARPEVREVERATRRGTLKRWHSDPEFTSTGAAAAMKVPEPQPVAEPEVSTDSMLDGLSSIHASNYSDSDSDSDSSGDEYVTYQDAGVIGFDDLDGDGWSSDGWDAHSPAPAHAKVNVSF